MLFGQYSPNRNRSGKQITNVFHAFLFSLGIIRLHCLLYAGIGLLMGWDQRYFLFALFYSLNIVKFQCDLFMMFFILKFLNVRSSHFVRIWLFFLTRTASYYLVGICNSWSWNLLGRNLTLMVIGYVQQSVYHSFVHLL